MSDLTTPTDIPGLDLHVDPFARPGTFQQDGSIAFDELDFRPTVTVNQRLAKFVPPDSSDTNIIAGLNVTSDVEDDGIVFFSSVEGVCRFSNNQFRVFEVLDIPEDVSFETGNLQFEGSIYIKGKVGQGFKVKAGGDVIVCGDVESGAQISAMGLISVGGNVNGIRTKLIAMESVQAGCVNDASIMSGRDITLGGHSENATLRSGSTIQIRSTGDGRGGNFSGGQAWALHGLDLVNAGTPTGARTHLNAGLDLDHGKKLDDLTEKIETGNQQIQRLLDRFGLAQLDVGQIQKRLAAAQGPKKKILANSARQLGVIVQAHQLLLQERAKIQGTLVKTIPTAQVTVREKTYAGVAIRIGDQSTHIRNDIESSVFMIRNDTLTYASIATSESTEAPTPEA